MPLSFLEKLAKLGKAKALELSKTKLNKIPSRQLMMEWTKNHE
jgi:hypothetical protein